MKTEPIKYKAENKFAFIPVFIRNKGFWGHGRKWIWFRPYTRIYQYGVWEGVERYRTVETVLGWHAKEANASIEKYLSK